MCPTPGGRKLRSPVGLRERSTQSCYGQPRPEAAALPRCSPPTPQLMVFRGRLLWDLEAHGSQQPSRPPPNFSLARAEWEAASQTKGSISPRVLFPKAANRTLPGSAQALPFASELQGKKGRTPTPYLHVYGLQLSPKNRARRAQENLGAKS